MMYIRDTSKAPNTRCQVAINSKGVVIQARITDAVFSRAWGIKTGFAQVYIKPWTVGPYQTRTGQRVGGSGRVKLTPIDPMRKDYTIL